jgi:hypothetical protein
VCAIATRPYPSAVREPKKKHGRESAPKYTACASKQGNSDGLACYVAVPLAGKHVTLVGRPDPFSTRQPGSVASFRFRFETLRGGRGSHVFFFFCLVRCSVSVNGHAAGMDAPLRLVRFFSFVSGSIRPLILEALRGRHPGVGQEPYIVAQTLLLALVSVCVWEERVVRSQFTRRHSGTRQLAPSSGDSDFLFMNPHPAEFFFSLSFSAL